MTTTESEPSKPSDKNKREASFESKLTEGRQRFLSHVIEQGLSNGRRTPEDFIRHFSPAAIMQGLKDQAQLRANILVIATGVRSKIALKKTAESCGADLQIALDEGETDAETITQLLDPDDRVRYLEERALWAYVTEGAFWQSDAKDKTRHAIAAEHVAFMIERALKDRLLTQKDVVEGITVAKLAELLPRTELEKIITAALKAGSSNKPYTESNLLGAAPPSTLVKHVPLPWIWDHVIVPKIAQAHGFAPKDGAKDEAPPKEAAPAKEAAPPKDVSVEPPRAMAAMDDDDSQDVEIEGMAEPSIEIPSMELRGSELDLEVDDVLGDMSPKIEAKVVPRPAKR